MKRNKYILLLLIFIISGCGHNSEEERTYYDNGALKCKGTLVDGKREGLLLCYYPDGKVKLASNWKDGKRDGRRITYYRNGEKEDVYFFKKGVPNGQIQFYDSTGTLRQIGEMVDGKQQGMDYVYDENSSLLSKTSFKDDKLHGKSISYDKNGRVKGRYIYENDSIVYSIEYLDEDKVTNRLLNFENKADSSNSYKIGEIQHFTLRLKHSYYDDTFIGLILGKFNDSNQMIDTLQKFTSDSLILRYQLVPKKKGINKVRGYVYEIRESEIQNYKGIEYEFEVK